jgi:hypothetical protein
MSEIRSDVYRPLVLWTVYDHPEDYPHSFVARKFLITYGQTAPTLDHMIAPDIDAIRDQLMNMGLVCLERHAGDDPVIVETWI